MGRPNEALLSIVLQAELEGWLTERDNPAPMLRWAAEFWGGAGTKYGKEWVILAERNAQLWDRAYQLDAVRPTTKAAQDDLAATMFTLFKWVWSNPVLHPVTIMDAMHDKDGGGDNGA